MEKSRKEQDHIQTPQVEAAAAYFSLWGTHWQYTMILTIHPLSLP